MPTISDPIFEFVHNAIQETIVRLIKDPRMSEVKADLFVMAVYSSVSHCAACIGVDPTRSLFAQLETAKTGAHAATLGRGIMAAMTAREPK